MYVIAASRVRRVRWMTSARRVRAPRGRKPLGGERSDRLRQGEARLVCRVASILPAHQAVIDQSAERVE